jgi:hypothetical protein
VLCLSLLHYEKLKNWENAFPVFENCFLIQQRSLSHYWKSNGVCCLLFHFPLAWREKKYKPIFLSQLHALVTCNQVSYSYKSLASMGAGRDLAQLLSTCLACARPWVLFPATHTINQISKVTESFPYQLYETVFFFFFFLLSGNYGLHNLYISKIYEQFIYISMHIHSLPPENLFLHTY